jgi:hypothetical protein
MNDPKWSFWFSLLLASVLLVTGSSAHAELRAYEPYNYYPGGGSAVGESRGTSAIGLGNTDQTGLTSVGWGLSSFENTTSVTAMLTDVLNYTGGIENGGAAGFGSLAYPAAVSATAAMAPIGGTIQSNYGVGGAHRHLAAPFGDSEGAVTRYVSVLMHPRGVTTSGGPPTYFAGLQISGIDSAAVATEAFMGYGGSPKAYRLNATVGTGDNVGNHTLAEVIASFNTTQWLVGEFIFSGDLSPDSYNLYINPPAAGLPVTPHYSASGKNLGDLSVIGIQSWDQSRWDELKVADTYEDLVASPTISFPGLQTTTATRANDPRLGEGASERLIAIQDAMINSAAPTVNSDDGGEGSSATFHTLPRIGGGSGDQSDGKRGLLQFDTSGIPAGAIVTGATMYLTPLNLFEGNTGFEAFRLTTPWDEATVTWDTTDGNARWTLAGGDFAAAVEGTASGGHTGLHEFDLTSVVQDWVDGVANHGLAVMNPQGASDERGIFNRHQVPFTSSHSGPNETFMGTAEMPVLIVNWTNEPVTPGDANGDGVVDAADLAIVLANWAVGDTFATGDFNGDDTVDVADLSILVGGGAGADLAVANASAQLATVPEPSTWALALFGLMGLLRRRLRRSKKR